MDVKRKDKKHLLLWFLGLLEKRLPLYLGAIFLSSVGTALSKVANAWIVENVVETAQSTVGAGQSMVGPAQMENIEEVLVRVTVQFLFFVLGWCLWRIGIVRYNIEGRNGTAKLEKMVFAKAMRLPFSYYEEHHSGDFISKLIYDTERASDIYASRLRRLLAAMISAVVYLIPMMYYSPPLTLCLIAVSMGAFVVNRSFVQPMKQAGKELAKGNGIMMESLTNLLAGMELVKTFPIGKKLLGNFVEANRQCFATQKRTNRMSATLSGLNNLFDLLGTLAFLGLGVWFVSRNLITLGALSAIYTLYGSFRYVFLEIGQYFPELMNCLANVENLYEFLQLEEEPESYVVVNDREEKECNSAQRIVGQGKWSAKDTPFAVCVEDVTFGYREEKEIFSEFLLKVKKGQCVAIVGESGSGKSTLAKLLLGFYPVKDGNISICGKNRNNSTTEEMRDLIAYVPQEPYLYGVSIAENIAYGRSDINPQDIPMEDIIEAAKIANAHDFIMRLPEGYNTIPGERGNTLSGGEKQRIAIARAVLRNAPILLLDEATSALDNESERLVNEALKRVCKERTTIMIAHRQSTIALADEVIVV